MKNPLLIVLLLTVFASCTDNKMKSQKDLQVAKEFYLKSKYDSAIVYLNHAVKLDTSNSEAYYYLSKSNYKINNLGEALKFVDIAEHKKYNSDSTDNLKLKILFDQEKYDEFIANCDRLIKKNSSDYKIYFEKSTALFNKADKVESNDEKVDLLKKALDNINISLKLNNTNKETFILRGAIRFALDDFKGAINDFNLVIIAEKKDSTLLSKAYRYKGLTEKSIDNLTYAETLLDSAISFNKELGVLYLNRGDIRFRLDKFESACDDYRKSLELGENTAVDRIRERCK